jgi:hypothetical protein
VETATKQRLHVGTAWFSAEAFYVALITALAVFGMSRWSHRPVLLIATLLAMPCGLVALFGLYALTGLFNSIAGSFSDVQTSGTPVGAQGFRFNFSVVALFTIAALANVLLLRFVMRRSRGGSADPSGS